MKYLKVRKGPERFWCVDLGNNSARCDNETADPTSPKYREVFSLDGYEILESQIVSMRDHLSLVKPE